jgi:hypothetical protein
MSQNDVHPYALRVFQEYQVCNYNFEISKCDKLWKANFFHTLDFCSILVTKIISIQYLLDHMLSWVWTCYKIKWTQHMTTVLQGVCLNLNIFVTYEFLKIIIDIIKKDRRWKYFYRSNTINWWNQMVCMSFKFDNFPHSCKYDLPPTRIIKKNHLLSSIIYCTWMSFLYLFYLNHCRIFHIFDTLICKIDIIFL